MEENTNIIDTEICENEENISDISKEPVCKKVISFIKKCFLPENLKKTVLVLIAFVLAIGIVTTTLVYFSPGNVAKRFVEAAEYGDIAKIIHLVAYDEKEHQLYYYDKDNEEELFEYLSDYEYEEKITSWRDFGRCRKNYNIEYLEDYYGEYKITIETSRVKHMSLKKLESEIVSSYHINYGFDIDSVSAAKEVTVKYKIKGEDETDRVTYTVWVVKVNGFWKVLDWDYDWD